MDATRKLKIVDLARAVGLWEEPSKSFKERQRQALRNLGVPKLASVELAWQRLELMLALSSLKQEPFAIKESPEWSELITDYESRKQWFDRESGWAFAHYGEENLIPRSEFSKELIQFGDREPAWFFLAGAHYFCSDYSQL